MVQLKNSRPENSTGMKRRNIEWWSCDNAEEMTGVTVVAAAVLEVERDDGVVGRDVGG